MATVVELVVPVLVVVDFVVVYVVLVCVAAGSSHMPTTPREFREPIICVFSDRLSRGFVVSANPGNTLYYEKMQSLLISTQISAKIAQKNIKSWLAKLPDRASDQAAAEAGERYLGLVQYPPAHC